MKRLVENLTKKALIVALILTSGSVYGVGDVKISPISGSKKAKISFTNDKSALVHLSIRNENGTEYLYSEEFNDEVVYSKIFNFNDLDEGVYKIVAESDLKIVEKDIAVNQGGITVIGESEKFKPFFKIDDKKLIISYLNKEEGGVKVNFLDNKGVFFSDKQDKGLNFMKSYDLKNLQKGEYVVSLNNGDATFNYFFMVH